ncbi:MAG: helix-hairpin-helix domain-containing protein [Bacteroidota bacterium]|jgi:hypothetical protein
MAKKTFKNVKELGDLPNIGKSITADLKLLGIHRPEDLRSKDAFALYNTLCGITGKRQDPCVLDVFMSAISFVNGGPALPWWHFTAERKAIVKQMKK